jgi:3-hydroxyisobutyrate dehydrogenase
MDLLTRIAFIGLGAMGRRMAARLVKAGFDLIGYDVSPAARDVVAAFGASVALSAAEAAHGADIVILMVVNAAQAEAVLFPGGVVEALGEGRPILLMSTCPAWLVSDLAERVVAQGRQFIDAPVSGGTAGAEAGTLTIVAAAAQAVLEPIRPVFEVLGAKLVHVGDRPGQAATLKTVNQLLCGIHIAAAAEAFAMATKCGLDPHLVLDVLGGSAASSWMLKDRGPRMLESDPAVSSAVDIFVKDLGLVIDTARHAKAAVPLAAIAHQMFLATSGRGLGSADDSQVLRSYAALNGT